MENTLKTKSIKDAVHGYIQLEEPFWKVINTAEFQRLKWIQQTRMNVLYPSAKHDRFTHSIGTYHLGQKALDGFLKNAEPLIKEEKIPDHSPNEYIQNIRYKYRYSFLLACLLHDIGHAPFSHTCENLFCYTPAKPNSTSPLDDSLLVEIEKCNEKYITQELKSNFKIDYKNITSDGKHPAPHEIMSALIIVTKYDLFHSCFNDESIKEKPSLDLVIRSILGCTYGVSKKDNTNTRLDKGVKNCLIRLLNSQTVDVDKLDYIARDALMSGYQNVILDNERLLSSLSYVKKKEGHYLPAFNKSALSILNNVISAKNSQAQWIFHHPIAVYDQYLLNRCVVAALRHLINKDDASLSFDDAKQKMFALSTLSKEGTKITEDCYLNLLSDCDIMYLIKQSLSEDQDGVIEEFLDRSARKHPVWKSHEEYCYYITNESMRKEISKFFFPIINSIEGVIDFNHSKIINDEYYNEIKKSENIVQNEEIIEILNCLRSFCQKFRYEFDFVFLKPDINYWNKIDGKFTFIRFGPGINDYLSYNKLFKNVLPQKKYNYAFFYLYSQSKIDPKIFLTFIKNYLNAKKLNDSETLLYA